MLPSAFTTQGFHTPEPAWMAAAAHEVLTLQTPDAAKNSRATSAAWSPRPPVGAQAAAANRQWQ